MFSIYNSLLATYHRTMKTFISILSILLAICSFAVGAEAIPAPCEASCSTTSPLDRWTVGGFMEGTIRVNNHGARSNGDIFSGGNESTDFNLNQLWLTVGREMDTSKGFDWGATAAFCFGMDGPNIAKWHDQSFDYKWGSGDYGLATNNLKVLLGYKKLSVEAGIFGTPLGWEGTESWDNFFMSGALINSMMPTSHLGFLAHYELSDRLTLSGGLTNGFDNGGNRFHDKAFVGGFEFQLTDNTNVAYTVIVGSTHDGILPDGEGRYGDGRTRGYLHTLAFCWNVTKRFDWIVEWMLADNTSVDAGRGRPKKRLGRLIYDKGCDSDPLRFRLLARGTDLICPHRKNRVKPPTQDGRKLRRYRRRYKIERTNSWLQNYRRLVVRYDNKIQMFDAFLQLACCMICARKL
ncbi:hypothetical protein FACS1894170_04710 [Planctomycetales bacterium]|nr:hypothetical protein FACS1894170_04710 [Planctomycetales bacterium]